MAGWSPEEDAVLLGATSYDDAARQLGRTRNAIIGRRRRLMKASAPRRLPCWTPAQEDELRRLIAAGKQVEEIASELNRTPGAVQNRIQRLRLNRRSHPARFERLFRDRWARAACVGEVTSSLKITRGAAIALAEQLGLPPLPTTRVEEAPLKPRRPRGVVTKAQIAWAIANIRHPEARLIAAMLVREGSRA